MRLFVAFMLSFTIALPACYAENKKKSSKVSADDKWLPLAGKSTGGGRKPSPAAKDNEEYRKAIQAAAGMTRDARIRQLVQQQGLRILNITWEDTGRYKGSSVGPNISDMSIQVGFKNPAGSYDLTLMPVIRYDNFSDKTVDIDPMLFTLLVGNEKGKDLKRISLREFLENPTKYLHNPKSWLNPNKSLLAERDKKVLVSAQASFLPVPKSGKAEFNPVLFNYQSVSGDPAVLTILVTRQGSSATIIDNKRDSFDRGGWGQRLFHNQDGQRASLTGQRISDFSKTEEGKSSDAIKGQAKLDVKQSSALNMVLLIQVPLKQKNPRRGGQFSPAVASGGGSYAESVGAKAKSDVEAAVIGHGEFEGPYTEIDNLSIERDERFPVRVTVQFYKATATGRASAEDIKQIKNEIESVYSAGDSVGSLVVAGETGRITEYEGIKVQPVGWWNDFWRRHQQNTGETPEKAIVRLRKLLGKDYMAMPVCELYVAEKLRKKSITF